MCFLLITIVTCFVRPTLLDGRQSVFSSLKVVLAMLDVAESRSALPFRRGTDGQSVFSSLKVVLAMLVFVERRRVGWQKCVLVVVGVDNNNSGLPVCFLSTVTILLIIVIASCLRQIPLKTAQ